MDKYEPVGTRHVHCNGVHFATFNLGTDRDAFLERNRIWWFYDRPGVIVGEFESGRPENVVLLRTEDGKLLRTTHAQLSLEPRTGLTCSKLPNGSLEISTRHSEPLILSPAEVADLIAFMRTIPFEEVDSGQ